MLLLQDQMEEKLHWYTMMECNGATIMLQAASIYTKGEGGHWDAKAMIEVMMDVARTSLKMLGKDLFNQLTKK